LADVHPENTTAVALDEPPATPEARLSVTIARNVAANWAGHILLVISGFILPRFVSDHLGQDRLGVWDFGWSVVAQLGLLTAGVGSAVNRYVAAHLAVRDWKAINRSTSSCAFVFLLASFASVVLTLILRAWLPRILPISFADYLDEARWVVFFLGLATAVQMCGLVYHGVVTGCQRYDLAVYAEGGCHVGMVLGLLATLFTGHGLKAMGAVILAGYALEAAIKWRMAHHVCPTLRLSVRDVTWDALIQQMGFGGKYFVSQVGKIGLYQGNNLLVALFMGPGTLAIYARAMVLVAHAEKLLFNFGRVLIPTASGAQSSRDHATLARLMLQSTRYSTLIALPLVMGLVILGKPLIRIWMGPAYAQLPLIEILAIGHFVVLAQTGGYYTLMGMNRHGIPALAMVLAAVLSIATTWLCLGVFHLGLISVALSVGASVTAANLLLIPAALTRASDLTLWQYFRNTLPGPVAAALPFAIVLLIGRLLLRRDLLVVLLGSSAGAVVLGLTYWRWALPESIKAGFTRRVQAFVRRKAPLEARY